MIRSTSLRPELPSRAATVDDSRPAEESVRGSTEKARILEKFRSNFCETSEDIKRKLEEMADETEKQYWIRSSPADLYYKRTSVNEIEGTARLDALCKLFKTELVDRGALARKAQPVPEDQPKKLRHRVCRHKSKFIQNLYEH